MAGAQRWARHRESIARNCAGCWLLAGV